MKQLNNSQPFAVSTTFRPLHTQFKIIALGGLSTTQFYRQTTQEWIPDHTKEVTVVSGKQTDGTLRLHADYGITDPDNSFDTSSLIPQIYWFIKDNTPAKASDTQTNGTQVTSTDLTDDYYIVGRDLYVRKNFTHLDGVSVYCEARFTDPRSNTPMVLSDTVPLSGILQADEQWSIAILCDRTRKHFPLSASPLYSFEAEARLGSVDKTSAVAWFWDYSLNNGSTWQQITDDCLWYRSGKNASVLNVDVDFISNLMVRARIGTKNGKNTAAIDQPNEATASIAWRFPKVTPVVFSYGGDRVFKETVSMTFGLIVHVPKHDDMTEAQKRHWLLTSWCIREQGNQNAPRELGAWGLQVDVPQAYLFNTQGKKYIVDPRCGIRDVYDIIADENGEVFQMSNGETMAIRT